MPFRSGCDSHYYYYYYFWIQVCYGWPQKKWLKPMFTFFGQFLWQQWSYRRGMKAVIDSFEIYTINFLMKKKTKIETNFIVSRALFWIAQPKQKKIFFSRLRWKGVRASFFLSSLQKQISTFFSQFFFSIHSNNHFGRAIACIQIRLFQLKSGEMYRMLHGRKLSDFHWA